MNSYSKCQHYNLLDMHDCLIFMLLFLKPSPTDFVMSLNHVYNCDLCYFKCDRGILDIDHKS